MTADFPAKTLILLVNLYRLIEKTAKKLSNSRPLGIEGLGPL